MEKNLATEELKQIWNNAFAIVVSVATVAIVVEIMEQRQRRFYRISRFTVS